MREIRDDTIIESLTVQDGRICDWAEALLDERLHLVSRQSDYLVSVRENYQRSSIRLIDAYNDIALRDQLFDSEGVRLAKAI